MATYGTIPGVQISTSTGTVAGVTIGRAQYLTLVGVGAPEASVENGLPEANEIVQIDGRKDAKQKFGEGSDISEAYERALANGVNPNFVNAVRAETTAENVTLTDFVGELANTPIVPDPNRFTVEDDGGALLESEFRYESPVDPPTEEDVLYINPITGEYDIDTSSTEIVVDYEHADWDPAIEATSKAIDEAQFGVITPLAVSDNIAETLSSVIADMRDDMKMAVGLIPAEPNATDDGPWIDTDEYELPIVEGEDGVEDTISNDTMWISGPTALEEIDQNASYGVGAIGALGGLFAGNATDEPVYSNTLSGIAGLSQDLSRADVANLRDKYVVPLRDTGTVRVKDNHSTYNQEDEGGWERDFFRRRVIDLTVATMFQLTRRQMGGVLDDDMIDDIEDVLISELTELVEDGLLQPGEQEVSVYRIDDRTIGIDSQIRPYGVAKSAQVDLEIIA